MKNSYNKFFQLRRIIALTTLALTSAVVFNFSIVGSEIRTVKQAQSQVIIQKIEALVNDEIISGFDLQQRISLIVAASGAPPTDEELERLGEQVLRSMVDERLQLQEAAEFEVEIEDAQLEDAFNNISRNFQQTPEEFELFLLNSGSSKRALFEQLRAEFAWQAIVEGRLGGQISISDEEVDQRIQRIIDNTGKYEYRVAEIYLIVDNPTRRLQVRETADRLYEQLERGTQFFILAQQFSETSTASSGGDMGWVSEDQFSRELGDVVSQMSVGSYTIPVFSGTGYHILNLLDRRRILSIDPMDVEIELHNMYYPFDEQTTQEGAEAWLDKAETIIPGMNSCEQIPDIAGQLDITEFGLAGNVPLRQLNPQIKDLVINLEIGHSTEPVISGDGIRFFFVCSKTVPEIIQPNFNQVFAQLESERLALMARRYLRDLRRDSIVDYK